MRPTSRPIWINLDPPVAADGRRGTSNRFCWFVTFLDFDGKLELNSFYNKKTNDLTSAPRRETLNASQHRSGKDYVSHHASREEAGPAGGFSVDLV